MPDENAGSRRSDEDPAVAAARSGDIARLAGLIDERPERLELRTGPYGWTLLHVAASEGRLPAVDLLLRRGIDPNVREHGDDTYPMHWAAAAGRVDIVQRLADAGGDVIGHGDDHELEVIGWATCWDGCDDAAHREVADFLTSRGARHHIFSAIALSLADEVRALVGSNAAVLAQRMSRNESGQLPLHFAIRRNLAEMVALLLELGADPGATDAAGMTVEDYAASAEVDRTVVELLARAAPPGLFTALVLGDDARAQRIMDDAGGTSARAGALHRLAKRGDSHGVAWLLARGSDPNARWSHWGALVTPLHLAAAQGHADVVRTLLEAGADPTIRDSVHDGDAIGWAASGRVPPAAGWQGIVRLIERHQAG